MLKFSSSADEIRYYVKELLSDRKEHKLQDIKEYVEKQAGKTFSHGNYAGTLRDLVKKEEGYENVGRAVYQYMGGSESEESIHQVPLKESIQNILLNTIHRIESEAGSRNPLHLDAADFKLLTKIKMILVSVEGMVEDLDK
ncbi:hypothetical protein [Paenibacillus eucommiae]|uniref:Tyrosyl-tRNA synthetase n=1 Tax=Paenibacillus eucommiae TaxID=1355755 RepID=A0ABS4J306_9BACL|nr:hypothetical protein [Paenibacillus eucommiae]MBP1994220.1 tyrosyl-tRNA synthetase [Paenibacillus eucommiae]